jgi:RNA polymerase sigma-70 factor (ECF subfamily)
LFFVIPAVNEEPPTAVIQRDPAAETFALACQQMRWSLNDLARRLDERPPASALPDAGVAAAPDSTGSGLSPNGRRVLGRSRASRRTSGRNQ